MGLQTKQRISFLFFVLVGAREIPAQTAALALTSTSVAPGAAVNLNLTLTGASAPAGLQWTLMPPAGGLSGVTIAAGPVLAAAGKALQCSAAAGTYTCLASGLNRTQIGDGVVALVSGTASTTPANLTIGLDHTVAASPAGKSVASTGAAGTILIQSPISLSQLSCVPSSLVTPSSSTCTIGLNAAAPAGGVAVAVSSDNSSLTMASSVMVPAGANSADFSATASAVSISQNATVTAMLSGTSRNAVIALAPPAPVTPPVVPVSLACDPASLVAGSGTCTLILSGLAPSGGASVSLVSSNAALAVPPSVAVPAGASSASFTVTASAVGSSQSGVITALFGGSSVTNSVVLNPAAVVMAVGPGASYASPCAALSAAPDGARIRIDAAGAYTADVCTIVANNLTIEGVHGRPRIDAAGMSSAGQAAWVFQGNNISIDSVEITGAASAANNGAAILMAGTNLKVVNSNLHDNQAGLVTVASSGSQVLIQATEFSRNGFGDGFTHNVDIGAAARLTMQYCYSHDANGGDLAKSQASENYLLFNRLTSEQGTTNTELDLTHGGRSFLIGNLIEKSPSARGGSLVGYLLGGITSSNPSSELYVVNNTFVNDKGTAATFLNISAADSTPALVTNNIFYGAGAISTQPSAVLTANLTTDPLFANRPAYDYRLTAGSPAIDAGVMPSQVDGVALLPAYQYLHPSCGQTRNVVGAADIGAYEFGGAGTPLYCALAVSGIAFSQNPVVGGAVVAATVTLSVPAPSAGTLVTLTSSNPGMAAIPASVTIPSGASSATFTVSTAPVSTTSTVTISASYSGGSQTASLIVTAPPVALASFGCSPVSLTSGATSTCSVTLSGAAPSGGATVTVSSNSGLVTAPPSVTVAAGSISATFQAKAGTIPSNESAVLTASFEGVSQSVTVSLVAPVSLTGLVCSPTTLTSNSTSICTVTLSGAAPAGGTAVTVSINSALLTATPSVTVAAGLTSATFQVKAGAIASNESAVLTASFDGASQSVTLALVAPANLAGFLCSPTTLTSSATSNCTLMLSGAAPSGGATVSVSSDSALLTAPPSVTVAAGSNSATFQVKAGAIPSNQSAVLTASYSGASLNMTVALVAPVSLAGLVCSPTTLTSGATSNCTLMLSGAAPTGGATVTVSSNSALLTAPASVTIVAGSNSATFQAMAGTVPSNQSATLTALFAGASQSVTVALVAPLSLAGLVCSPTTLTSGATSTCSDPERRRALRWRYGHCFEQQRVADGPSLSDGSGRVNFGYVPGEGGNDSVERIGGTNGLV